MRFNHLRVDVSTTDDDKILQTAFHVQEAMGVDAAQVSGSEVSCPGQAGSPDI